MKVLMFGWEFPPHISGGLGTACFGLTKGLIDEHVEVLFVVPRLVGDEPNHNGFLINASSVAPKKQRRRQSASARKAVPADSYGHLARPAQTRVIGRMAYLEIPSSLSPYQNALRSPSGPRTGFFESWSYALIQKSSGKIQIHENHPTHQHASEYDDVEEIPDGQPFSFSGTYGNNLMSEVKRYAEVAEAIAQQYTFDVIHAHDWMTFPAGLVSKRKSGKPLILHVHSTEVDRAGMRVNSEVFGIEKRTLAEADKIIAVSNWTKQILISHYGISPQKVAVVHNGILPKEKGQDFDFPAIGSHFITFLGRVTHQKGPGFFVEAAHKVLKEYPQAHFIVAGAGDLLPQIIERVAQLNMSANFHFTGFLSGDQVDRVWSLTDVYVMPSVSEPFGIAPLEAIQGGVPVILSNQSGVAEVMPHAIKVDFWDTKGLAAAICSVLRYESLSEVLRQNSKRHIQHLSWDKAARQVKEIYHEVRGKRKR